MDILNVLDQIYSDPTFFSFSLFLILFDSLSSSSSHSSTGLIFESNPFMCLLLRLVSFHFSCSLRSSHDPFHSRSRTFSLSAIFCHFILSFIILSLCHTYPPRDGYFVLQGRKKGRNWTSGHILWSFVPFQRRKDTVSQRQTFVLLLCSTFFPPIITFLLFFFFPHVLFFVSHPLSVSPSLSFSQYSISITNHFLFMLTRCRYKHKRGGHERNPLIGFSDLILQLFPPSLFSSLSSFLSSSITFLEEGEDEGHY